MRTIVLLVLILLLGWYIHLIGEATDRNTAALNRNTASLGALWARVEELAVQVGATSGSFATVTMYVDDGVGAGWDSLPKQIGAIE